MAIQFFCVACGQPIEVDDELANQAVTCPYCRKVVTAPAVTDSTIGRRPADARTASLPGDVPTDFASAPPALPATGTNVLSWVALVCTSATLVTLAVIAGFMVSVFRGVDPSTMSPEEMNKLMQDALMARPVLQVLIMAGLCGLPLVSVICGVIALIRRTPPKWPAIVSLCVSGGMLLCMCSATLMQAAQMAGQAAP